MSLINLFVAARSAMIQRRQQRRAYHELMALDDRSLADIGLHRSQIPALVEGLDPVARTRSEPDPVVASAFGCGPARVAAGPSRLPPL
jgi:uncharacterized protein YjiS (DUF1127 family)